MIAATSRYIAGAPRHALRFDSRRDLQRGSAAAVCDGGAVEDCAAGVNEEDDRLARRNRASGQVRCG